jgi:GNAT superfamily N-acetyltransferase
MRIRAAETGDAAVLAALRYEFRSEMDPPTEPREAFEERMRTWWAGRRAGQWRAWIGVDGDEPIGDIFLQIVEKVPNPVVEPERLGYITSLYVVPSRRNAAVGGALLDRALEDCRREGLDTVVLWPSSRSRPLYQRRGFVEKGDVMELPLVPHPGRSG